MTDETAGVFDAMRLTDQVAVVTGAGAGIGRAIAMAYAEVGADIVVADRIPERCESVAAEIRALGRRALAVPTDVRDTAQVSSMIERGAEHFGHIDILVNNAGGVRPGDLVDQAEIDWRRAIDFNLVSALAAIHAAVPVMIAGGRGGSIVNVTSIEASRAAPGFAVYAACKAAVNSLTRTLALELAEHRIRVNALAPDHVDTPGLHGNTRGPVDQAAWVYSSSMQQAAEARRIPLGRPGRDVECGRAAVFLSSRLSSYITGTILAVDGGTQASSGWLRNSTTGGWTISGESLTDL